MSLPQVEQNGVFTRVKPVEDLALSATLSGSASDITGTTFTTGYPATVWLISKLTSGSATIKMDRHTTADNANMGSADVSLSASGTSYQVARLDTTDTELYVTVETVGASAVFADLKIYVTYELEAGEDWFVGLRSSANAVGNTSVGDGSGVTSTTIE